MFKMKTQNHFKNLRSILKLIHWSNPIWLN